MSNVEHYITGDRESVELVCNAVFNKVGSFSFKFENQMSYGEGSMMEAFKTGDLGSFEAMVEAYIESVISGSWDSSWGISFEEACENAVHEDTKSLKNYLMATCEMVAEEC